MASPKLDIYSLCPCGSGKKLKFCCHDAAEQMVEVVKLIDEGRHQQAFTALEKVEAKYPRNLWALSVKANLLSGAGRTPEAQAAVKALLAVEPKHPFGLLMDALLTAQEQGLDAAQSKIDLAFSVAADTSPEAAVTLATTIGTLYGTSNRVMALRAHLQWANDHAEDPTQKSEIAEELDDVDESRNIPYPIRSPYQLIEVPASIKGAAEAQRLATRACFGGAAEKFRQLAEKNPRESSLWINAGLCSAWSGNEEAAVAALHRGAELETDFDRAVEFETIAQLLEVTLPARRIEVPSRKFKVHSIAKLLTMLDAEADLARIPIPPLPENDPRNALAGLYDILDRPLPTVAVTLETVPYVRGQLTIVRERPGKEDFPVAILTVQEIDQVDEVVDRFRKAAGPEIGEELEIKSEESFPVDYQDFHWRWRFSTQTPPGEQRKLTRQKWEQLIRDAWPATPLYALGGKSPDEATGDPALQVKLAAAIYTLEALCEPQHSIDVDALRNRCRIPEAVPLSINDETDVEKLSFLQLRRVPYHEFNDSQMMAVLLRAGIIQHHAYFYDTLTAAVSRLESLKQEAHPANIYRTLVDLCQERLNKEEALIWLNRGRDSTKDQPRSFEFQIMWDLKELGLRLDDTHDDQAVPLARRIVEHYGRKIPGLSEQVHQLVSMHRPDESLAGLLMSGGADELAPAGGVTGGVWTPDSASSDSGSGKLWLPGQE
ncbi:MAG: tetratricopeptide repeat protein [Planctomycetaceae bacterium]|nr:tetratricopeptide repeat protein [Planctomycetaceae bacterium]